VLDAGVVASTDRNVATTLPRRDVGIQTLKNAIKFA
jgi:hypothetical protein